MKFRLMQHLSFIALTIFLTACAGPKPMPQPKIALPPQSPLHSGLEVGAVSAPVGNPGGWSGGLWDQDSRNLLTSFLKTTTLLAESDARYDINLTLVAFKAPEIGGEKVASETIRYQIVSNRDQSVVMDETIEATHTIAMSETFMGIVRARLAIEGATRDNFNLFFEKLAASGKFQK